MVKVSGFRDDPLRLNNNPPRPTKPMERLRAAQALTNGRSASTGRFLGCQLFGAAQPRADVAGAGHHTSRTLHQVGPTRPSDRPAILPTFGTKIPLPYTFSILSLSLALLHEKTVRVLN